MDLTFSPEERRFPRGGARLPDATTCPRTLSTQGARGPRADQGGHGALARDAERARAGWPRPGPWNSAAPAGRRCERHIFEEECCPRLRAAHRALRPAHAGAGADAASAARRRRTIILPRILTGATGGARAIREPGAGSDLASLKTPAVRDGDDYVINGQKTWTTLGQHANRIFCLVRTSSRTASRRRGSASSSSTSTRRGSRCGRSS